MKIVENKVWEYCQESGIDGVYKAVRDAAAICYQTDVEKMKMTPVGFVENVLLKNGHTRPLEFGTVYLCIPASEIQKYNEEHPFVMGEEPTSLAAKYAHNPYSRTSFQMDGSVWCITTNLRVIMQGYYKTDEEAHANGYDKNWLQDLIYWSEPTEAHARRRTFTMWMSRGCTDDFRTHVSMSSMCESTRFCNYNKDKFGNELTGIRPYWIDPDTVTAYNNKEYVKFLTDNQKDLSRCAQMDFLKAMETEEKSYLAMAKYHESRFISDEVKCMDPLQPQQLKRLFPLWAKAELRLCGYDADWQNFFWRRCDGHADPECTAVSNKIKNELW